VKADVIVEVLRCLGEPPEAPVPAKARPPPQSELEFPATSWDA
jgi:hypothetical protein